VKILEGKFIFMKKNIAALFSVVLLSLSFAVAANAQTENRKLKIIKKPTAEVVTCGQRSGLTMLRVTFDKSAKVTKAEIVRSSGCAAFDNNSITAARGIKFEPEIKDGAAVTVSKPVEYRFEIY
jgi:TonB family protein